MEVFLELRHAADVAAWFCVKKPREIMPRGVVFLGGGYYSYRFWYNPRGKTGLQKEGHKEEQKVDVTEKLKHNYLLCVAR